MKDWKTLGKTRWLGSLLLAMATGCAAPDPELATAVDAAGAVDGTVSFPDANHAGNDGSALAQWNDADGDGQPDQPVLFPGDSLTGGVKAPRLTGAWSMKRFLHNGSVPTLEALFCLDGPRPTNTQPVFSDKGHMQTCDGLTKADKTQLIAYLRSI